MGSPRKVEKITIKERESTAPDLRGSEALSANGDSLLEERRSFIRNLATAGFAGILAGKMQAPNALARDVAQATADELPPPPPRSAEDEQEFESIILRMQSDLRRALSKPVDQRKWVMVIDQRKCVGCHACTISCKSENKLPPGVVYRPVIDEEKGTYPNVRRRFTPRPCMQCENPPCVPVCPVTATYKRPDGIVAIDYDVCIGCRYCITSCPYNARTFDFGDSYNPFAGDKKVAQEGGLSAETPYETAASFEYSRCWERKADESPIGNVRKCHFCLHRLENGMLPACTATCLGGATYFGDASDADSMVSELIGLPNAYQLKAEVGTHPSVFYIL